jgi:hypothetical protein
LPVLDERTVDRLARLVCDVGGAYERRPRDLVRFVKAAGWDVIYEGGARIPWLTETIQRHNDDPEAIDALLRRVIDPREFEDGLDGAQRFVPLLNDIVKADGLEVDHVGQRAVVRRVEDGAKENSLERVASQLASPELRRTVRGLTSGSSVADVLIARLDEVEAARRAGAYLLAVIGTGSFVEGLLDDVLRRRDKEARAQTASTLDWLLQRTHSRGWIQHDALTFSGYVREYRNFVHPREQLAHRFTPDDDTVLLCWQPVLAVINDLDRLLPGRDSA